MLNLSPGACFLYCAITLLHLDSSHTLAGALSHCIIQVPPEGLFFLSLDNSQNLLIRLLVPFGLCYGQPAIQVFPPESMPVALEVLTLFLTNL
jgi:hypothetical protein